MTDRERTEARAVTDETVEWAFRLFLDREPEGAEVVARHRAAYGSTEALRRAFLSSLEFARRNQWVDAPNLARRRSPMAVDVDATDEILSALFAHTQDTWQRLGTSEPYWSVLSADEYRSAGIEANRERFERSGQVTVDGHLALLESNGVDTARFSSALDYGCGVGRSTWWLSQKFSHVYAYDASATHLRIAQDTLATRGCTNVDTVLVDSIQSLGQLPPADLVYSILVLQHNPPPLIARTLERLLRAVASGGAAVLQLPTFHPEYSFDLPSYLARVASGSTRGPHIEVHLLPQRRIHQLIRDAGCTVLEVLDDRAAGPGFVSNTFVVQRAR